MAFRHQQISDDEVQTLLKTYGNRHGTVTGPKAIEHAVAASAAAYDEEIPPPILDLGPRVRSHMEDIFHRHANNVLDLPDEIAEALGGDLDDRTLQSIRMHLNLTLLTLHDMVWTAGFYR